MTDRYPVNDLYPCIQGEGVLAGTPMVLLRLHGCAVGCVWCDTKETWHMAAENEVGTLAEALGATPQYVYLSASEINDHCRERYPDYRWILLTGGEPAQYPLKKLVAALHDGGYKVAIETSGTESGHLGADLDWVCVSPKIKMPGGKAVRPEALATADEIKMVVGRPRDVQRLDQLLETCEFKEGVQICVQPLSQNPKATALCIEIAQERGWRLSLQMHKYLGQR